MIVKLPNIEQEHCWEVFCYVIEKKREILSGNGGYRWGVQLG